MTIAFTEALDATGARAFDAPATPLSFTVSTDTRALAPGACFIALRGERFDGHAYVKDAVAAGACAVVIDDERTRVAGVPTLVVADTKRAYMQLAGAARARFHGRVAAITGSTGKTTTKAFLAQLLALRFGDRVLATPANENNEIGVSKLLLAAGGAHDVLVIEMGARREGEIAELAAIARPDVGILTNIGEAHLEIMGSRERLAQTKWGLFATGADAVLNADDEQSAARAETLAQPPAWFAAGDGMPQRCAHAQRSVVVNDDRVVVSWNGVRSERSIDVQLPGRHNRANLAAAIAGAVACGVDLDTIVAEIPTLRLPSGRFERIVIDGRPRIVFDAYNANYSGMLAALDAFAQEPGACHIAVLSGMAELGPQSGQFHRNVGEHAARCADVVLAGGDFADDLAAGARSAGLSSERIVRFATNLDAARWLDRNTHAADVVLLKGSRKYRLEEIVERLRG